LSERKNF